MKKFLLILVASLIFTTSAYAYTFTDFLIRTTNSWQQPMWVTVDVKTRTDDVHDVTVAVDGKNSPITVEKITAYIFDGHEVVETLEWSSFPQTLTYPAYTWIAVEVETAEYDPFLRMVQLAPLEKTESVEEEQRPVEDTEPADDGAE